MSDNTDKMAEISADHTTELAKLADGHNENAMAIRATRAQVEAHETVIGRLIDQVETIAESGLRVAETGAAGATVQAGAELVQEIVDFLHRLFPGHGAPGVPTKPTPTDAP